jgi:transcriptional regulator with XRE-family HTH domain
MTQEELADRAGLSKAVVSLMERHHREISLERLEALATALGRTPDELLRDPRPHLTVTFPERQKPNHPGSKALN